MVADLRNRLRAPVRLSGPRLRLTGGIVLVGAALSPPMSRATGMFLTAHMVQHVILLQLAPLLILTGLPTPAQVWRAPISPSRAIACWAAGVSAMTLWYTPVLFAWMMRTPLHHSIVQASLVATGLLFWLPVFSDRAGARLQTGPAIGYLFTACVAGTIAGAAMAFARPGLFAGHMMSPLDQQLAGLVMWVPCCTVYVGAIMATLAHWYGGMDDDRRVAHTEA
jgi:cytochrome c oxidase assembly factor CtaG